MHLRAQDPPEIQPCIVFFWQTKSTLDNWKNFYLEIHNPHLYSLCQHFINECLDQLTSTSISPKILKLMTEHTYSGPRKILRHCLPYQTQLAHGDNHHNHHGSRLPLASLSMTLPVCHHISGHCHSCFIMHANNKPIPFYRKENSLSNQKNTKQPLFFLPKTEKNEWKKNPWESQMREIRI